MGSLRFHYPDWPAPPKVKALSTTRVGGVSCAPYNSLNLGLHVEDDKKKVALNRQLLKEAAQLPSEPCWLNQVHGIELIEVDAKSYSVPITADGSYTKQTNTVCAVLTADCLPLLLTDRYGSQVAAVHVGWRGMVAGIVEKAVQYMDSHPKDIIAWAGPCIGPTAFEIGTEVRDQLEGPDEAFTTSQCSKKMYANLPMLTGERLRAIGVLNFSASDLCTFTHSEDFFSYRRQGECGRMATMIWLIE